MPSDPRTDAEAVARIDPADLERRANAMRTGMDEATEDLVVDLLTAVRIQRGMLLDGVPAHLTPSEQKMAATIMRQRDETAALRAALAEAREEAYAQGARDEQSRVQSILRELEAKREEEGDSIRSGCYDLAALRTHSFEPGKSAAAHALRTPAEEARDGER